MKPYLDLLSLVLKQGEWQDNRTGIRTLDLPGASLRYDLTEGFPAVTTKKLAFKSVIGELIGFLRSYDSAADFRALGCKVWDQNANENQAWLNNPYRKGGDDDLGPVYGVQWRRWPAFKALDTVTQHAQILDAQENHGYTSWGALGQTTILFKQVDQLGDCIRTIMTDPGSRRILFHGWNPAQLEEMALPPCHLLYQFLPNATTRSLSMTLYIRSNDLGLGLPFNQASAAALLHLVARLTGYKAKWLSIFIGSAHIYENHLDMVREQLARTPYASPQLILNERINALSDPSDVDQALFEVQPEDFALWGYEHHPPIKAAMAV